MSESGEGRQDVLHRVAFRSLQAFIFGNRVLGGVVLPGAQQPDFSSPSVSSSRASKRRLFVHAFMREGMKASWKESIYLQREALARILREPMEQLAGQCAPAWGDCAALDAMLVEHFASIEHCSYLYCMGRDGMPVSNNVGQQGIVPGHFGRDRSQRPCMKEAVPAWGFLLSDAYISLLEHRPSLTALQVVSRVARSIWRA